jgi:1-acyl-sn-glycerol-3-phosphate acyltransferase
MKKICYWILKLFGYTIDIQNIPEEAKKCVLLFAPHTSMLDFVVGKLALVAMGVKTVFLIKKEVFWFPLGIILKALGGLPVDRQNARNFPSFAAGIIRKTDRIALLISPEGTRKRNPKWKKGFYVIAQEANVPIVLGYLDYHTKKGGIMGVFHHTGDMDADILMIKNKYKGMRGRYLGQFDME